MSRIFEKTSVLQRDSNSYRYIDNIEVSTILTTERQSWIKYLELLRHLSRPNPHTYYDTLITVNKSDDVKVIGIRSVPVASSEFI